MLIEQPFIDILEINGKLTKFPLSVYANLTATDVWTFTFNAASAMAAVKPLIALMVVVFMIA